MAERDPARAERPATAAGPASLADATASADAKAPADATAPEDRAVGTNPAVASARRGPADPPPPERGASALTLQHVAWPGRPASDGFARRVLGDPRVARRARELQLAELAVDAAPAGVGAALGGAGTIARHRDGGIVAIRRGVGGSAAAFLAWIDRVERDVPSLLAARGDPNRRVTQAEVALRLGLVDEARRAAERAVASRDPGGHRALAAVCLATGDVAAARAAVDAARRAEGATADAPDPERALLEARLLLAERHATAALERLAGVAGDAARLCRAEAHAARGETEVAHALFAELAEASSDPELADRARQAFASGVFEPHTHRASR